MSTSSSAGGAPSAIRLVRLPPAELPRLTITTERATWVDMAKGISISLVASWHFFGRELVINEPLIFLRMPLFFFAAGLFARATFRDSATYTIRYRIVNFLYLYVTWSILLFIFVSIPHQLRDGEGVDVMPLLLMFLHPTQTLWFIYALVFGFATIWLFRRVPLVWLLVAALVLYAISILIEGWYGVPFPHRVIRMMPFLLLGLISYEILAKATRRVQLLGLVCLVAYYPIAHAVHGSALESVAPVTLGLGLLGAFGVLMTCKLIVSLDLRILLIPLAYIGLGSLYVYVMHRIPMVAYDAGTYLLGWSLEDLGALGWSLKFALFLGMIFACVVVGRMLARTGVGRYLFEVPPALVGGLGLARK